MLTRQCRVDIGRRMALIEHSEFKHAKRLGKRISLRGDFRLSKAIKMFQFETFKLLNQYSNYKSRPISRHAYLTL